MEDDKATTKSGVVGGVWASEINTVKETSSIDIDVYDIEKDDKKKRVYCVKRSVNTESEASNAEKDNDGDDKSKTSNTEKDNNSKNYQVQIIIDVESGELEKVDFGKQVREPITVEKITEIQKSINVWKTTALGVSYGRIAPIKDISAILSLMKEDINTIQQNKTSSATIEKINKSGIRFLCFTEDENSSPETKRNRLIKIMRKALDDGSIKVVSVMYSLQSIDNVDRHSIVVMGCKKDWYNDNLDVKIFDSNGSNYESDRSYSDFKDCTDITLLNTEDEHVQSGKNCSYWSEGDLIVVFRKHLQKEGITKEHLTDQKKNGMKKF